MRSAAGADEELPNGTRVRSHHTARCASRAPKVDALSERGPHRSARSGCREGHRRRARPVGAHVDLSPVRPRSEQPVERRRLRRHRRRRQGRDQAGGTDDLDASSVGGHATRLAHARRTVVLLCADGVGAAGGRGAPRGATVRELDAEGQIPCDAHAVPHEAWIVAGRVGREGRVRGRVGRRVVPVRLGCVACGAVVPGRGVFGCIRRGVCRRKRRVVGPAGAVRDLAVGGPRVRGPVESIEAAGDAPSARGERGGSEKRKAGCAFGSQSHQVTILPRGTLLCLRGRRGERSLHGSLFCIVHPLHFAPRFARLPHAGSPWDSISWVNVRAA